MACAVAVLLYVAQLAICVALDTCTDADAPDAMSPKLQLSVFVVMLHAALAGLIDHAMPGPVGSGSLSVTDFAVPGAGVVHTVIVNPILVPALTVPASATFVIDRLGQFTVMEADACTELALVADAVAVFGYDLQLANVVGLVTWTDADPPLPASVPKLQLNVFELMLHAALAGLIDQLTPVPVGSGSFSVTPVADARPEFDTVIVNPMASPALTVAASATFVIEATARRR